MAIFSTPEIIRRHDALRGRIGECDAVVAASFFPSYYLSGVPIIPWGRPAITMVPREGEPAMILPAIERERAAQHSPIADLRTYSDMDGPSEPSAVKLAGDLSRSWRARRIGFDGTGTSAALFALLRHELPEAELVDISGALEAMMLVSSEEELRLLRAATAIADIGIATFIREARIGVPEVVLAGQTMLAMSEHAAKAHPDIETRVNCYSQQGTRSLQPHTGVGAEALRRGELVSLVVEVYAWNYQVAVERPLVAGEPTPAQRRYLETVGRAHEAAIEVVRPGASFGGVDRAAREVLLAAGYDQIHCGAGLVRGLVTEWQGRIEGGNLRAYNEARLQPDIVVTVEPWAQVRGVGGSRHCDVVRVTAEGHEIISTRHRGVVVIG